MSHAPTLTDGPNDPGTTRTDSGLIVPEHCVELEREIWSPDELRMLNRAEKLAARKGLRLVLVCLHEKCAGAGRETLRPTHTSLGLELRCGHKTREVRVV